MNNFDELMVDVIAPLAMEHFRANMPMIDAINTNIDDVAKNKGDTIKIATDVILSEAGDFVEGQNTSPEDIVAGSVDLVLDTHAQKHIKFNATEAARSAAAGILDKSIIGGINSVISRFDSELHKQIATINNYIGNLNDDRTVRNFDDLISAKGYFSKLGIQESDGISMLLSDKTHANMLSLFAGMKDSDVLNSAFLGHKFGMDLYEDTKLNSLENGTSISENAMKLSAVPVKNPGELCKLNVEGLVSDSTFIVGQILEVTSASGVNKYTVARLSTGSSGTVEISINEKPATDHSVNDSVTVVEQSRYDIALHKSAIVCGFRMPKPELVENNTSKIVQISDGKTGIPMLMEYWYEPGNRNMHVRFDTLFGIATPFPERALRVGKQ